MKNLYFLLLFKTVNQSSLIFNSFPVFISNTGNIVWYYCKLNTKGEVVIGLSLHTPVIASS